MTAAELQRRIKAVEDQFCGACGGTGEICNRAGLDRATVRALVPVPRPDGGTQPDGSWPRWLCPACLPN